MKNHIILIIICGIFCLLWLCAGCSNENVLAEFLKDTFPPRILSITPDDGSSGVLITTNVTVTFSEPMEKDSVEGAFSVAPENVIDAENVIGDFTWSGEDQVTFNPVLDLNEALTYSVTITTDAMDKGGNPLENDRSSSFSTNTFPKIRSGQRHVIYLKDDSTVWCWGDNGSYQLAQIDNNPNSVATEVGSISEIGLIDAGNWNSFALQGDGTLFAWGRNQNGCLGIGSVSDTYTPTEVSTSGAEFVSVASGDAHTIALDHEGNVWVWGLNTDDQLGIPALTEEHEPVWLDDANLNNKVIGIAAGNSHCLAVVDVDDDGDGDEVYAWGSNSNGQIGNNTSGGTQAIPFAVIIDLSSIQKVAAGAIYSLALKTDGSVWTWGLNNFGQLGLGDQVDRESPTEVGSISDTIIDIEAGYEHTLALKEDGSILSWGTNEYVQLGLAIVPVSSQEQFYTTPQNVANLTNIIAIDAGSQHSVALRDDGTVWTWGMNTQGQLGLDMTDFPFTSIPEQVPGLD
jgi:alpha-tubulin suppressor-like RCC1 family protein